MLNFLLEPFVQPYARPSEKRSGAWMSNVLPRSAALAPDGSERMLPVCYLVCNQTPPVGEQPSLMTYLLRAISMSTCPHSF